MITTNVLQRTFQIRYGEATGTCFTIDVGGRQYLVTARHVVKGIEHKDTVHIQHEKTWKELKTSVAWISSSVEDIAILSPKIQLSPSHPLEPTTKGIVLGQSVYFCGYPYGLKMELGRINRGFPLPLVRHGILSGLMLEEGHESLIIDGHNNPGFSGGPVVFTEPGSRDYKVAGCHICI